MTFDFGIGFNLIFFCIDLNFEVKFDIFYDLISWVVATYRTSSVLVCLWIDMFINILVANILVFIQFIRSQPYMFAPPKIYTTKSIYK